MRDKIFALIVAGMVAGPASAASATVTLACPAANATLGIAYSTSLSAIGGIPPYTYSLTGGTLPAGLTLNTSTGAITGTPAAVGSSSFTAHVVDSLIPGAGGSPDSAAASCAISVAPPPSSSDLFVGMPIPGSGVLVQSTTPVTVQVTSLITGAPTLPATVDLYQADSTGTPRQFVTTLYNQAGDGIFIGTVTIPPPSPGVLYYVVSALLPGSSQPLLSPAGTLEILPQNYLSKPEPLLMCPDPVSGAKIECNRLAAFFPPGTNVDFIRAVIGQFPGARLVDLIPFPRVDIWLVQTSCTTASCIRQQASILNSDSRTSGAEINVEVEEIGVPANDTNFRLQWGIKKIQVDKAWAITTGRFLPDRTTVAYIAVIDTGIDGQHEDLKGLVVADVNVLDDINNPRLRSDHGTSVAAVILANTNNRMGIAGTSWDGFLISVRALDPTQADGGTGATVAKGIRAAVAQRARIINMSLSSKSDDGDETIAVAMDFANKAGRLMVTAAGNRNCDVGRAPASFGDSKTFEHFLGNKTYNTYQIVVGATDKDDARGVWNAGKKCKDNNGSNYGPWVNIYAPGVDIETAFRNNAYTSVTGTSIAAPFVASVANLVWAARPSLTKAGVRDIILSTADAINTTDADGNAIAVQRLNAFQSVLKSAALTCNAGAGECPNAPEVSISQNSVVMGTDGAKESDTQPASFHGVSVSMERPQRFGGTGWLVNFDYKLKTWDAYQPQTNPPNAGLGYWDVFTMMISPTKYWELKKIKSPLDDITNFVNNPGMEIGLLIGGKLRGDGKRDDFSSSSGIKFPWDLNAYPYLSIMLDTARAPQTDNKYPSFGSIAITDLTPQ